VKLTEEWLRIRQFAGLVGIYGYHNLFRRAGHLIDSEGTICHRVGQLASRRALDFLRLHVQTHGLSNIENLGDFCVVSNHASYLDWVLLLAHFPTPLRFIAKRELTRMPIIGAFLRHRGVLIDRARGMSAKAAIRAAVHDGQPYPIMIFPEGTRTHDGKQQPFKRGGLRILAAAGRTFVPVSLRGTYEAFPRKGRAIVPGSRLELVIGRPLDPADFDSVEQLISTCEQQIRLMTAGDLTAAAAVAPTRPSAALPASRPAPAPPDPVGSKRASGARVGHSAETAWSRRQCASPAPGRD
jgi:1-acyl-sn-glycerol-3-phosphate acyltransferase